MIPIPVSPTFSSAAAFDPTFSGAGTLVSGLFLLPLAICLLAFLALVALQPKRSVRPARPGTELEPVAGLGLPQRAFRARSAALLSVTLAALALCLVGAAGATELATNDVVEISKEFPRLGSLAAPVEIVSITRRISYADLDLTSRANAREFQKRIRETAVALCQAIDQKRPLSSSPEARRSCIKDATARVLIQVRAAVAAADKRVSSGASRDRDASRAAP
jgi:UrcA family protein